MKPVVAYGGYAALALSLVLLSSRSAYSGGQASGGLVRLQPTSPGSAQTGHLNINGTAVAGQFQGGGAGVTDLNAGNLTTGTVPDARLGVGGDITGPLSATSVTKLRGRSITTTVPTAGQVLGFNGTSWTPANDGLALPFFGNANSSASALTVINANGSGGNFQSTGIGSGVVASAGSASFVTHGSGVSATSDVDGGFAIWARAQTVGGQLVKAGHFENVLSTPDIVVDLATNTEAVRTNGFVWREYNTTAPSAAIPVAYGTVSSTGTILGGTGNFTVVKSGTGQYSITIDGETYNNNTFAVSVSPVTTSPRVTAVADNGVPLFVSIWNLSGTLTDTPFQFTVFATNPANPG